MNNLRKEYGDKGINKENMNSSPMQQFAMWFQEAMDENIPEANAMALATCKENIPSVRIVLLKYFDENGFVFFTNYKSRKGQDIEENDNVSVVFWWEKLNRQIRIEGKITKISRHENEKHFAKRPAKSQLSAVISKQSSIIKDRKELESKVKKLQIKHSNKIPCPSFWGGYKILPTTIEFWQGRKNRLHDRICFYKKNSFWDVQCLAP